MYNSRFNNTEDMIVFSDAIVEIHKSGDLEESSIDKLKASILKSGVYNSKPIYGVQLIGDNYKSFLSNLDISLDEKVTRYRQFITKLNDNICNIDIDFFCSFYEFRLREVEEIMTVKQKIQSLEKIQANNLDDLYYTKDYYCTLLNLYLNVDDIDGKIERLEELSTKVKEIENALRTISFDEGGE